MRSYYLKTKTSLTPLEVARALLTILKIDLRKKKVWPSKYATSPGLSLSNGKSHVSRTTMARRHGIHGGGNPPFTTSHPWLVEPLVKGCWGTFQGIRLMSPNSPESQHHWSGEIWHVLLEVMWQETEPRFRTSLAEDLNPNQWSLQITCLFTAQRDTLWLTLVSSHQPNPRCGKPYRANGPVCSVSNWCLIEKGGDYCHFGFNRSLVGPDWNGFKDIF
jgi:hypothetical protein